MHINETASIIFLLQAEKDLSKHTLAARMGAWISLDGLNEDNSGDYLRMIKNIKDNGLLDKILLSHDAGWYSPGKVNGGEYRNHNALFEILVPLLRKEGFSENDIQQLLVKNPAQAYSIKVRKTD